LKYFNLNDKSKLVSLKEATLTGIQGNSGLFMPMQIPQLKPSFIENISQRSLHEIAFEVAQLFLSEEVSDAEIQSIITDTLNFEIPLVQLQSNVYCLELFHGPTFAFKDIGARFMARLFARFLKDENRQIHILVATSGDTGSAVANAFWNVPNIDVTILYPSGKVSLLQEKQLTTLCGNINALEIDGTFDDCQHLVKQAFADNSLQAKVNLASANSINLARLIPQSFYYFWAYAQYVAKWGSAKIAVCVPSGNFGNLTAGLFAKKMGLPIHQFIAATNANDVVPQYLSSGNFVPRTSLQTISNAMDVGNPSNFSRIMALYDDNLELVRKNIVGYSFSDDETRATMKAVAQKYNYVLDPHGAVAYAAIAKHQQSNPDVVGVFFETAHPAKFDNVVEDAIGVPPVIPHELATLATKEKVATKMKAHYELLKAYLLQ